MKKDYNIKKINTTEDGAEYKVDIRIPMSLGWIDDMYFTVVRNHKNTDYKLKHIKNEDGYVYFSTEIFLETCAIYRTYFTFTANGRRKYTSN